MSTVEPTAFTQLLGALLQNQRQRKRLTQAELAELAELSLKYVGEIERGEANVTAHTLEQIAKALGWNPWSFFDNSPPPISHALHALLLAELTAARDWFQRIIDWLTAFDPSQQNTQRPLPDFPRIAALMLGPRRRGRPPNDDAGGPSCP